MKNRNLIADYLTRAEHRLKSVAVLLHEKSYADVVRESQELIELCLKALLRKANIDPPLRHDVSSILLENASHLPQKLRSEVVTLAKISKKLRRDLELAFYGSEDLTPSEFYTEEDAKEAFKDAKWVVATCRGIIK